jgi:hypothetical protein
MQTQAREAAERRDALHADAIALQSRALSLSEEQRELALKVAASQRALADASQRLDAVKHANAAQTAELIRLRAREAALKQQLEQTGQRNLRPEDRSEIERLETQNQELAGQIDRFIRQLPVGQ